jgi:hypothetical protein
MKGLVKKVYVEQAFLSVGLERLDEGVWLVFRVTGLDEDVDVLLHTKRSTAGLVGFKSVSAHVPGEWFVLTPQACGGDDDVGCYCSPAPACNEGCTGPGGAAWINTGDTTGPGGTGNMIYERADDGARAERCSDGKHHIVISPI